MYVIDAKSNEAMTKPGYTNVFFTINGGIFIVPILMTIDKNF